MFEYSICGDFIKKQIEHGFGLERLVFVVIEGRIMKGYCLDGPNIRAAVNTLQIGESQFNS